MARRVWAVSYTHLDVYKRQALQGKGSPITGAFDLEGSAKGQDMRVGVPEVDTLLKGAATVEASVLRDTKGTTLRRLDVKASSLSATASGQLATAGSDIAATLDFRDLRALGNGYRGAIAGRAQLTGTLAAGRVTFDATGQGLGIGQTEADRLLAGESRVSLVLGLKDCLLYTSRCV